MCKTGGPYCYGPAKTKYVNAMKRFKSDPSSSENANRVVRSRLELNGTPARQMEMEQDIDAAEEYGDYDTVLQMSFLKEKAATARLQQFAKYPNAGRKEVLFLKESREKEIERQKKYTALLQKSGVAALSGDKGNTKKAQHTALVKAIFQEIALEARDDHENRVITEVDNRNLPSNYNPDYPSGSDEITTNKKIPKDGSMAEVFNKKNFTNEYGQKRTKHRRGDTRIYKGRVGKETVEVRVKGKRTDGGYTAHIAVYGNKEKGTDFWKLSQRFEPTDYSGDHKKRSTTLTAVSMHEVPAESLKNIYDALSHEKKSKETYDKASALMENTHGYDASALLVQENLLRSRKYRQDARLNVRKAFIDANLKVQDYREAQQAKKK